VRGRDGINCVSLEPPKTGKYWLPRDVTLPRAACLTEDVLESVRRHGVLPLIEYEECEDKLGPPGTGCDLKRGLKLLVGQTLPKFENAEEATV